MQSLIEQLHNNVATLIDAIEKELGHKMKKQNYKTTIDTLNKVTSTLLQINKIEQIAKASKVISDTEDERIIQEFLKESITKQRGSHGAT